jgi:hypothetical protein
VHNAQYFKNRQGHKGKIVVVAGHTCKVKVDKVPCGAPATLSKTENGVVKRTCSIHWHTPAKQLSEATETLLRDLGLVL